MSCDCRYIMPSGRQCHGYALRGEYFCYFHSRRRSAKKPASAADLIDIPVLEERCVIQLVITQTLRALLKNAIDRHTATTVLYGLQLALQSVDHFEDAIPIGGVEAVSRTPDGEEIAAEPDDYDEEEDADHQDSDEDDEDEKDREEEAADSNAEAEGSSASDRAGESANGAANEQDDDEGKDNDEGDDLENQSTEKLIAEHKYLQSINRALEANDMKEVARLLHPGG